MRTVLVFSVLLGIKCLSRFFYRTEVIWVGEVPSEPWDGLRLVAVLNHTSLYEPLFAGGVPNRFLWNVARNGVVPAADKTLERPLVGRIFRLMARDVVAVTRRRDHTWQEVVRRNSPRALFVLFPEGRMKRAHGRDKHGNPMTVRGGIADLIASIPAGRMLLAYSEGLHHVQAPGQLLPRLFKTIRLRLENLDIPKYREAVLARAHVEGYKEAIIADLERRRDRYCVPSPHPPGRGS